MSSEDLNKSYNLNKISCDSQIILNRFLINSKKSFNIHTEYRIYQIQYNFPKIRPDLANFASKDSDKAKFYWGNKKLRA